MILEAQKYRGNFLLTCTPTIIEATVNGEFPRLTLLAYTGGQVSLPALPYPVVFDLSSTVITNRVPLLHHHNPERVVGHTDKVAINGKNIEGEGVLSGTGNHANEVRLNAANGFPWQLSVGLISDDVMFYADGETVSVNGDRFAGPVYVASKNLLREISFVSLGADGNTSATLVATHGDTLMNFEAWLASMGIDAASVTPDQKTLLLVVYNVETSDTAPVALTAEAAAAQRVQLRAGMAAIKTLQAAKRVVPAPVPAPTGNPVEQYTLQAAAERERIDGINSLAVQYENPVVSDKDGNKSKLSIAAHAIREKWGVEKAEIEMVKASRPRVPTGGGSGREEGGFTVLAAALAMATRLPDIDKTFTPQVLDAAHKRYKGRIGLQEFLIEAAFINGYTGGRSFKGNHKEILASAFSTYDVSGIVTANINKYMIAGYNAVDQAWREIAGIRSVSDFKETTGYRGVGSFTFEKVAKDGHIPHGTMSEMSFGNKIDTFGKMFAVTRQDQYNDDLGVFNDVPRQLGRGGAIGLVKAFWTELLNNAAFFVAGNNNVSSGALSIAGLTSANTVFSNQKDPNGDYLSATPAILLVPLGLYPLALQLYKDIVVTNATAGPNPNSNPWAGRFRPVTSPYMTDPTITGNSAIAYYLFSNPADIPVIEVAFLDGQQFPTVESADVDFSQLGIQMRGFWDWGVRKQDFRAGVRSTGV